MTKTDRRVQRTRELLQKALRELIHKQGYETITVQDIVDHANVARTTFYAHFTSKDDLFMSCHEAILSELHFGPLYPFSREQLLSPDAPPGMTLIYQHLDEARAMLSPIFQGHDGLQYLRRILREWSAQNIEANLQTVFAGTDSVIPLDMLANYLAGAQIALVHWWLETRQPHTPQSLAQTFHRLQRAAIRDAFGIMDGD